VKAFFKHLGLPALVLDRGNQPKVIPGLARVVAQGEKVAAA